MPSVQPQKPEILGQTAEAARAEAIEAQLRAIESSTIWRLTAPLRALGDRLRALRQVSHPAPLEESNPSEPVLPDNPEPVLLESRPGRQPIHPDRPTLLLVSHESSFTGAPILAWNLCRHFRHDHNLVLLTLRTGELDEAFLEDVCLLMAPPPQEEISHSVVEDSLALLPDSLQPTYAIVNTIQCWQWPEWLRRSRIPSLMLIHEFAAYIGGPNTFQQACLWSGTVVFSSRLTRENMVDLHHHLANVPVRILPQGRCAVPQRSGDREWTSTDGSDSLDPCSLDSLPELRAHHSSNWLGGCRLIIGAGTFHTRKGVDLFVETAHRLRERLPEADLLFLWLDSPERCGDRSTTQIWIDDQIRRSGLADRLHIVEAHAAYASLMRRACLFLLTSRLDPLPNVSIDALLSETPVLCFERASGTAAWLAEDPLLREHCLGRYLDPGALARQAERLLKDEALRGRIAAHGAELARHTFCMDTYTGTLRHLAGETIEAFRQEEQDRQTILQAAVLEPTMALTREALAAEPDADPLLPYLRAWRQGILPRKPFPGFHPGIYAEHHNPGQEDPLAHWLRHGRPIGPWQSGVIVPAEAPGEELGEELGPALRVGLHLHGFHPELLEEIFQRLAFNQTKPRLVLTLPSAAACEAVGPLLEQYGHSEAELLAVPNRGRDLGPLLVELGGRLEHNCDIHGHLHTKKSEHLSAGIAGRWRTFLLDHLIGTPSAPMLDRIVAAFAQNPCIGLVYPDDPHCLGWGDNHTIAADFARHLHLLGSGKDGVLPGAIDFPVGSMFWARTGALSPLYHHPWCYDDFPEEPLAEDGSVLHALERLLPLISRSQGFEQRVTHLPGSGR